MHLVVLAAAAFHLPNADTALLLALGAATLLALALTADAATTASATVGTDMAAPVLASPSELAAGVARSEIALETALPRCAEPRALMARVSHELRTPLNAVLGFSDLMSRELFGPLGDPRYQQYACHIHDSGRALLKSAEDTLAVTALLTDGHLRAQSAPVDLRRVAAEAWQFFAVERSQGTLLDIDMVDDVEVLGERRVLRQIMINLISEALTRSRPGGRLSIEARVFGDRVALALLVTDPREAADKTGESLAVCLARTMLELQGKELALNEDAMRWSVATVLDRAIQPDFFDRARAF